jgi:NAD dependent epimerase/dehydratase
MLITGAGGFIGSHLAEALVKSGCRVRAFVRYNSGNRWGWLDRSPLRDEMEVVAGDIRDFDSVTRAMEWCDSVFHLAALIGIPYSYVSPSAYIKTNVTGTYNVLEGARRLGVREILITSTSETYGTAQHIPIDENHPIVCQYTYSASKIGADQLAVSYYRSFGLPVKIVRPFNTYGPRQSFRAIIPTIIGQILEGREKVILGNIHPTRDLTFVEDTVDGFIQILASKETLGSVTNIGMNREISMGDLVGLIAGIMGKEVDIEVDEKRARPSKSEVDRLRCDNTRILNQTDWRPGHTLKQGLTKTVTWLEQNIESYRPGLYVV